MADPQPYEVPPYASSSMAVDSPRPQAGPLPVKRGEIGYMEEIHGAVMVQMDMDIAAARQPVAMGERHPADHPLSRPGSSAGTATDPPPAGTTAEGDNASSTGTQRTKKKKGKPANIGGVTYFTLFKLFFQLALLAGTGIGWAFSVIMLNRQVSQQQNTNNDQNQLNFNGPSMVIFVHVAFGIVAFCELIFLERRIFVIRAERYAHLHPGEMLSRNRQRLDATMQMVPWQRSLPTYAAALAQSGARTGDVEDGLIAQPPPPAYGKTRGSTLLLRGFLSREQSQRVREFDVEEQIGPDGEPLSASRRASAHSMASADLPSRPVSYRSLDSDWEAFMDMQRARAVEEALAAMEGIPTARISDRDRP